MNNRTGSDIELWLVQDQDVQDESLLEHYRSLLSKEERQRLERLAFGRHRQQFLISRALLREVLAQQLACNPAELCFTRTPQGKPELKAGSANDIRFNLSHTPGLTVLAVSRGHELGVDAEYLSRQLAALKLAERYFAKSELQQIQTLPPAQQRECFFDLWTLKEAWLKACGSGLRVPLDSFSFDLAGQQIRLADLPAAEGDAGCWRFWQLQVGKEHCVALALRVGRADQTFTLHCQAGIPLQTYASITPEARNRHEHSVLA